MRKIFANNATSLPTVSTELKADTTYIKDFSDFTAFKTAIETGLQSRTIVETATINTFLKTVTTILKNISTDGITEYIFEANYTPYKSIKHLKFGNSRSIYYATGESPSMRPLHPDASRDTEGYLDKRKLVPKTMLDDILTRMPINSTSEKGRKENKNLDFISLSSTYYLSIQMNIFKKCFLVQLSESDIIYKNSVIFNYKPNQPDTVTKKLTGWTRPSEQFFAFNSIYDNRDLNTQTTGGRIYILSQPNESAKYAGLALQEMFF